MFQETFGAMLRRVLGRPGSPERHNFHVPRGWKLVPVEPTVRMQVGLSLAVESVIFGTDTSIFDASFRVWRQVLESVSEPEFHPDDAAVHRFAGAMQEKMAISRAKGRSGWHRVDNAVLWGMLREHVEKGDPVDIANFAMMIWNNSERSCEGTEAHGLASYG